MPDVVILCGGRGTRAYPDTLELPKPLLPVAGVPVVEHVMGIYARHGYRRFVLASGYLGDRLADHFATPRGDYEVEVVDTGLDTDTGERIRRVLPHVHGDTFFATYADGLANIDLDELLRRHLSHDGAATLTTVPLPAQYGVLESDGDGRVARFREKPRLVEHWINGGFFVFERRAFSAWEGENLERDVLPALSAQDELYTYRHRGFWRSMDTFKDREELTNLAESGAPPWEATVPSEQTATLVGAEWTRHRAASDAAGAQASTGLAERRAATGKGNGHGNGTATATSHPRRKPSRGRRWRCSPGSGMAATTMATPSTLPPVTLPHPSRRSRSPTSTCRVPRVASRRIAGCESSPPPRRSSTSSPSSSPTASPGRSRPASSGSGWSAPTASSCC